MWSSQVSWGISKLPQSLQNKCPISERKGGANVQEEIKSRSSERCKEKIAVGPRLFLATW